MRRHHVFLISWLLAAAVMMSIAGLMAKPLPAANADRIEVTLVISRA